MKTKKSAKKADPKITEEALLPNMDYLHGIVVDNKFEAACQYEYSRESDVLREAAELHKGGTDYHEICDALESKFDCNSWFINSPWIDIWKCPSFPSKGWNQLGNEEREEILHMGLFSPPANEVRPLRMNEVWLLNSMGVFDEFKAMAGKQMQEKGPSGPNPPKRVYPIIKGWPPSVSRLERKLARLQRFGLNAHPKIRAEIRELESKLEKQIEDQKRSQRWVHALFTIDFGKTPTQLKKEFTKWLGLPENKALLDAHQRNPTGKTGEFVDRLKDLAASRLYRALGWEKAFEFADKNAKRDKAGKPLKFHDHRPVDATTRKLYEAPLYSIKSGESSFQKAQARALAYRAKLIPCEFGIYAEKREQQKREMNERLAKLVEEAQKTSKRSA